MPLNFSRRIDFPMVDLAGIVYYPVYWDLAHRFFELSWEKICGINYPKILQDLKLGFPAVKNECEFLAPLKYGDTVNCKIWISDVGNKSCTWEYEFTNQNMKKVWLAKVVTVCVNMDTFESINIPKDLAESLTSNRHD
ncbi:MAG: hypothetical protein CMA03_05475 [Euryarchaeota archaeon]|nr:hypothetical protein [Euryarchaeota archaeon]|tara:strand:- start:1098 stop:1511 length:414 start_codon:yes stop_codon:yes gene_type:complete